MGEAWREKKRRAAEDGEPVTARAPSWLKLVDGKWVEIESAVAAVRRVLQLATDGHGLGAITNPVHCANIVYKSHPYTSAANFQQYFGSAYAAGLPVFIGEFGAGSQMSMTDVQALLDATRQRGIGWAAWLFEWGGCPCLLADSGFTPTSPYGPATDGPVSSRDNDVRSHVSRARSAARRI